MAEPLGLVPRGAEGTGAAQIFRPFDSTPIFNAYDQQKQNLSVNLKNSFDDPVSKSTGVVHPNDRWYIQQARDKYLDKRTEVMAKSMSRLQPPSPQEIAELTKMKQEVADRLSLAQKTFEHNKRQRELIAATPYAYTPESRKAIEAYFDTPIDQRQVMVEAQKMAGFNYADIFGKIGKASVKESVNVTRPDGSSYKKEKIEFDPAKAEAAFNTQVLPMLSNTDWGLAFTDMIKSDIIEQDPSYLSMSPDQQAEIFTQAAKNYYVQTKKNEFQASKAQSTKAARSETGSGSGRGNKVKVAEMQPVVGREYVIYDVASGKRKDKQSGIEKGEGVKLSDAITIPIVYKENTPTENKVFDFMHKGEVVRGTPQTLRKFKGSKGWDKNYSVMVYTEPDKYGKSKVIEIPFTGNNRVKLEKEFGFNLDEINARYGNLEKEAEDFPQSQLESMPGWNDLSEAAKQMYRNAYNERFPAKGAASAAPAAPDPAKKNKWVQQFGR